VEDGKRILILSDPHYASAAERARVNFEVEGIRNPFVRLLIRIWRGVIWLRDPFAHNYLVDRFIEAAGDADLVVANGDFSCDSAFIGLADSAARQSAKECLGKLRERFGEKLIAVIGDHELGKSSLAGNRGGLRLESWRVTTQDLKIAPAWERRIGDRVLVGVTSSLLALDVYEADSLPEEVSEWRRLRAEHLENVRAIFEQIKPNERILLFCHDPTALPFLAEEDFAKAKLGQIERTVIGHLHTPLVFWKTRILAGFPPIHFLGRGVRRITRGLNRARRWKPFHVLLCPSLSGSQLLKDGGFYEMKLTPGQPAEFLRRRLKWEKFGP
jgi:predicted phosphodiesterase